MVPVMRELVRCWQHTRMIVLIALCAALYVSLLIPFKIAVLVPGITEIRPAAALPILFSILFGPAAAWGAAFGNTIGDFFGTIGPGTLFGFLGNFMYGFIPYRIVRVYLKPEESLFSAKGWFVFLFGLFLAAAMCAIIIAMGIDFLGIVPFGFLAHTIFLNNFFVSLLLVPLLFRALDKRIRQMHLSYSQIEEPQEFSGFPLKGAGPVIFLLLLLLTYSVLMLPSMQQEIPLLSQNLKAFELGAGIVLVLAALLLL